ncbi:MAG: FN3 associated domain-containing protein [Candidatus Cryptobacteroides sp.]
MKRLLNVKYSAVGPMANKCRIFEKNQQRIYNDINKFTLPGGACSFIHDFFREGSFYYVITEKIDAISFDAKAFAKMMTIEDKLFLFRIIAHSFLPLEKAGIIHGDVKPENILLKYTGERIIAKLIDFESAFHTDTPPKNGYIVGTEPYYSPELAEYNNEDSTSDKSILSTKSDIFALGVIFYEFLSGEHPVTDKGKYTFEVIRDGGEIKMHEEWSDELRRLIKRMLNLNPALRPNITELLLSLKELPDVSVPPEHIEQPNILIQRVNDRLAYIIFLSLNKNLEIQYNLEQNGWTEYSKPILLDDDDVKLEVRATLKLLDGKTETQYFTKDLSVSTSPKGKLPRPKIIVEDNIVFMECDNPDVKIHYTLDGSIPTKKSPVYEVPFYVEDSVRIKAISRCVGYQPSDVMSIHSSSKIRIS